LEQVGFKTQRKENAVLREQTKGNWSRACQKNMTRIQGGVVRKVQASCRGGGLWGDDEAKSST